MSRLCTTSTWLCIQFPLCAAIMSFRVTMRRFCDRARVSADTSLPLSLPYQIPAVFFFFLFFRGKKIEKILFRSWVPSATVTQHTGAKICESNFIFRIEYIKTAVTTHSTQGEKKKTSVPSQKVTVRGSCTSILVPQVCGKITPKTHTETPTL